MASGNGGGDVPYPKRTSSPAQKQIPSPDHDLEHMVVEQTEDVFQNFLYESYRLDSDRGAFVEGSTPNVPQLTNFTDNPLSATAQVGRRLAKIGDDIQKKYQSEFDHLTDELKVDSNTAYEGFAGVAKKLMEGRLSWGRITTLFCFGYRMFVRLIGFSRIQDFGQTLKRIVSNVVNFIRDSTLGIARWIANQGGWQSANSYDPSVSVLVFGGIALAAVVTLGVVYYLHTRH